MLSFGILADENFGARVIRGLRARGRDVVTAEDEHLLCVDDLAILRRAHALSRVVITQDSDFGALAIRDREPFIGIIYLRPGDLHRHLILEMLDDLALAERGVEPPFIVVVERRGEATRVRFRSRIGFDD